MLRCAEQRFEPRGLVRVVERVADGDAAVFEVMDDARRAAVDADEGHCPEDAFRAEPFGEAGFDAKSVHERHDARVRPEAWLHESCCASSMAVAFSEQMTQSTSPSSAAEDTAVGFGRWKSPRWLWTVRPLLRTASRSRRIRKRTSCPACGKPRAVVPADSSRTDDRDRCHARDFPTRRTQRTQRRWRMFVRGRILLRAGEDMPGDTTERPRCLGRITAAGRRACRPVLCASVSGAGHDSPLHPGGVRIDR